MPRISWSGGSVTVALALAAVLTGLPSELLQAQSTHASIIASQPAWDALRAGRLEDAADAFQHAIARTPGDPMLHLGAGLAAHLLGQPIEARAALEEALRLNPRLTEASLLLGEIAYRQDDLTAAIRTYEDALALAPDNARLRDRLARWRGEADLHDRFDRRLSDNFTILFEGAAEQALADRALQVLEPAYWRISTALMIVPPGPMTVVLYTEQQFQDVTRSPRWAAASFDGKIRVPVRGALEREEELERVLSHELTHALIRSVAPRGVPYWLNEGLAVVFEGPGGDTNTTALTGPAISLEALSGSFEGLPDKDAERAYQQSAHAARALLDLVGPTGINSLLNDLGRGVDFSRAFAERSPISFREFQDQVSSAAF